LLEVELVDEVKDVVVIIIIVVVEVELQMVVELGDELKLQLDAVEVFDNELMHFVVQTGEVQFLVEVDDGIDEVDVVIMIMLEHLLL
jgi:hypothetical protein